MRTTNQVMNQVSDQPYNRVGDQVQIQVRWRVLKEFE